MLTALSVARECHMVDSNDQVILVQAYQSPENNNMPTLEFVYADEKDRKVEEITTGVSTWSRYIPGEFLFFSSQKLNHLVTDSVIYIRILWEYTNDSFPYGYYIAVFCISRIKILFMSFSIQSKFIFTTSENFMAFLCFESG